MLNKTNLHTFWWVRIYENELASAILHLIFTWNIYVICAERKKKFFRFLSVFSFLAVCALLSSVFFLVLYFWYVHVISGWLLIFPLGFFSLSTLHFRVDCAKWFLRSPSIVTACIRLQVSLIRILPTNQQTFNHTPPITRRKKPSTMKEKIAPKKEEEGEEKEEKEEEGG